MNKKAIRFYIGYMLLIEAVLMLPSLFISVFWKDTPGIRGFTITFVLLVSAALACVFIKQSPNHSLQSREGFLTVGISWVLLSVFGALPFFLSGKIPNFADAFFETVSGLTTTGASILKDIDGIGKGLIFWRSFTHWIGGMGVLVFVLTIIPLSKGHGDSLFLLRAESPGPSVGKITPTMRKTARILYVIYIVMTVILIGLLLLTGMPLFDCFCNGLGAAGTGGFSCSNAGMSIYTPAAQTILGVFMALFGINFSVYVLILTGQWKRALKDEELRLYLGIILGAVIFITIDLAPTAKTIGDTIHHVFFTVSSIITTTGYATVDYTFWPATSRWVLVVLMLLGACAGSTGGGIKQSRFLIMLKSLKNEIASVLRPRSVHTVRLNEKIVDSRTVNSVHIFFLSYLCIAVVSCFLISFDDFDGVTTCTSVIACLSNIGPGMGQVGPMCNYSAYSDFSKFILSLDMLFGRLELFPMLLLFSPRSWKRS